MRKRKFLEPPSKHVDSYAVAYVLLSENDSWSSFNQASLKIADCSRSVEIGFGYSNESERRRMKRKMAALKSILAEIERALDAPLKKAKP